jgi:hypothetical protein
MTTPDELRAQAAALEAQAAQLETPLSADDVHQLYQERRYDEIAQAQANGRLAGLFNPTTTEGA